MKIKFTLIFLLISTLTLKVAAQTSDYVITQKGDTLNCLIRKGFIFASVKYKTDSMTSYEKINSDEIKQYFHVKDKFPYRAVLVPKNKKLTFLALLEEGKINLFQDLQVTSDGKHSYTNIDWYAAKGTVTLTHIKTNGIINSKGHKERKAELLNLIEDNKALTDQFNTADSYSFDSIQAVIKEYNRQAKSAN